MSDTTQGPDAGPEGVAMGEDDAPRPRAAARSRHPIEAVPWRPDDFRADPSRSAAFEGHEATLFEALETTMEELRVAAEELRLTHDALDESRAEAEAERRRYRDLFDQAPDAYLVSDLLGTIREANRATADLLQVEARFLPGKPLAVFVPEEGRPAFRAEMARLRDTLKTVEYDLRLQPRNLAPLEVSVRVGVVRDAWGRPVGLHWTVRDVSARKRAEATIRALNAQLERRVVEQSEQLELVLQTNERWLIRAHAAEAEAGAEGRLFQDLVQEADAILWRAEAATGRATFVSRRAETLLGYPNASWLESPEVWLDRVHPEDRGSVAALRRKHLRDGTDHESEYRVVAADGRAVWFRESVRVLAAPDGRPSVLCGLMVNITKRKKVERQLYTAKGELVTQLRDMTYLHELAGRLASARDLDSALREVLTALTSLLGTDGALVILRGQGDDVPATVAADGLPRGFIERINGPGPFATGTLGAVLASGEPFAIADVEAEPDLAPGRDDARAGGFRGLFGVPLVTHDGRILGAAAAFFPTPHRPPERQAHLVEMYAVQAADAIEAAHHRATIRATGQPARQARRDNPGYDPAQDFIFPIDYA